MTAERKGVAEDCAVTERPTAVGDDVELHPGITVLEVGHGRRDPRSMLRQAATAFAAPDAPMKCLMAPFGAFAEHEPVTVAVEGP